MSDLPTQKDVMLAILAMDTYSRGENPLLEYTPRVGLANSIGTAIFIESSDDLEKAGKLAGAATVGFSASQYALTTGETVISYRGTDFDTSSLFGVLIKDILCGHGNRALNRCGMGNSAAPARRGGRFRAPVSAPR